MTIEREKLWLDFAKFVLGTVAVGLLTLFVNSQLQHRDLTLQEQEHLSKFVDTALDKDLGRKLLLAEYFSQVTQSKKLRASWQNYLDELRRQQAERLDEISELRRQIFTLEDAIEETISDGGRTLEQTIELSLAREKLARYLVDVSFDQSMMSPEIIAALTGFNKEVIRQMAICGDGMKFSLFFDETGFPSGYSFAPNTRGLGFNFDNSLSSEIDPVKIEEYQECIERELDPEFKEHMLRVIENLEIID